MDYNVQALGCTIQGNIASAVRLCKQESSEFEVYLKARNNDSDIIGQVIIGPNCARYKYKVKIDPNLVQMFKEMRQSVKLYTYLEMI